MKVFFVLALLLLPPALAQSAPEPATIPVTLPVTTPVTVSAPDPATGPAAVADAAVREWLGRDEGSLMALANLPPAEMCQELLALTQNPPPPRGTRVNFDNRLESPQDEPGRRVYTYPAAVGEDRLEVVEAVLTQTNGSWQAEHVGFRASSPGPRLPDFFAGPAAGWAFVLFTALLLYLSFTPSFLRRWLERGLAVIREHRRLVVATVALLYGVFFLGMLTGTALPAECEAALVGIIDSSLQTIGVAEIAQTGDVAGLAGAITYWNFTMGTLFTTLLPAYLFALPAYLLNTARFYTLGIPFGFNLDPALLLLQSPVILLELLAYILVTAGGGMFLVTLIRKGFGGYREGLAKLLLTLPLALLLLVAGAWYEAFLVLGF
ncbi:hypothetical protein BH24DEI1_BH24DEI1_05550 [soil metagenome]